MTFIAHDMQHRETISCRKCMLMLVHHYKQSSHRWCLKPVFYMAVITRRNETVHSLLFTYFSVVSLFWWRITLIDGGLATRKSDCNFVTVTTVHNVAVTFESCNFVRCSNPWRIDLTRWSTHYRSRPKLYIPVTHIFETSKSVTMTSHARWSKRDYIKNQWRVTHEAMNPQHGVSLSFRCLISLTRLFGYRKSE